MQHTAESLVKIDLVLPTEPPKGGVEFEVAVVFRIEPKWHIYWANPGDSGVATRVDSDLPDGWKVGALRFPRPQTFVTPYETTFGYEEAVALFLPLTAPPGGLGDMNQLELGIRWMVCKELCFAGAVTRTAAIPGSAPDADVAAIIDRSRRRLPKPLAASKATASLARSGTTTSLRIEGPLPPDRGAAVGFVPLETPGVEYGERAVERSADRFVLTIPLEINPGNALGAPLRAAGLLTFGDAEGPSFDVDLPLAASGSNPAPAS
ncbi:MAG TPA: protein-disulfide reductase DsbD family protein [Phycisphaerales bacterium]|nr:protein-disulfide reductase DsbD family protein [Phycisphaerales bacterium]HMP38482.1 protein-disulfide reductase DsbD family protein [Phycisphaerales bacterium]